MFEKLVSIEQIILILQKPLRLQYLKWYKSNQSSDYHDGAMGHNIKNFHSFKENLVQLIEDG
jgi:hypothetical protein